MAGIVFSSNWDAVIARLNSTDELVLAEMENGMQVAVDLLKQAEAEYPPPGDYHLQGNNPPPFFSPRQRRFFFAALRDGTIEVPYRRTGALAAAWKGVVERSGGVRGIVSNDSPVVGYVMGDRTQSRMFEGAWQRGAEIFNAQRSAVLGVLGDAARRAASKILHG